MALGRHVCDVTRFKLCSLQVMRLAFTTSVLLTLHFCWLRAAEMNSSILLLAPSMTAAAHRPPCHKDEDSIMQKRANGGLVCEPFGICERCPEMAVSHLRDFTFSPL